MMQTRHHRVQARWMREGLGGSARHLLRRPARRQRFVARHAPREGSGLEIWPGFNPLARKADGFCADILDHADTPALRAKCRDANVNLDNIENVDFVWCGEPLSETIGRRGWYDWIIASHVIEHTPDLVGFLVECQTLRRETGRLILIVPDKCYCFDHFQSPSSTGDALDAHQLDRGMPSPGRVFDHHANAVSKGRRDGLIWHRHAPRPLRLIQDMDGVRGAWRHAQDGKEYIDVHNWHFTPESLRLVIDDLRDLGLLELGIIDGPTGAGGEFCVCLQRSAGERHHRMASLAAIRKAPR